jgi:AraC family transcriptional activator of tynA and feaB
MGQRIWQEFSTQDVAAPVRARRWAEFGSETLSEMTVSPLDGNNTFKATIRRRNLGDLGFVLVESSPALANSSATESGRWAGDGSDHLMMTIADRGTSRLSQGNWSADLKAGDIVLRDLARPWESYTDTGMGLILIKIPYSIVARHHADPERLVGRRLPASDPRVSFASTVIRASRDALQLAPDADWHDHLSDVIAGVFRLICHDDFGTDVTGDAGSSLKIRRSATSYIARHLSDPELSVTRVAEAVGVTPRHLQRAFMDSGQTPRQFILDQRLIEAARLLSRSGGVQPGRIIDIAFSLGFNDASHFTRAFAQKFGCSPSHYRVNREK